MKTFLLAVSLLLALLLLTPATLANDYDLIGECKFDLLAPTPVVVVTPAPPQPTELTSDVLDKYSPAPMSDAQLVKLRATGGSTVIRSRTVVRSSTAGNYAARPQPARRLFGRLFGNRIGCSY